MGEKKERIRRCEKMEEKRIEVQRAKPRTSILANDVPIGEEEQTQKKK